MTHFCPITGLPVTTADGWHEQPLDDHFVARFLVIGKSILYSGPSGMADLGSAKAVLELKKEVVQHVSGGTKPYIQIEDYARFKNATLEARKYFAQYMIQEKRVRSLIFCNLSLLLRIFVKIGSRLNTTDREIFVVETYKEAIELALRLSHSHGIDPGPFVFGKRSKYLNNAQTLVPAERYTENAWDIDSGKFNSRSGIIDNHILHSISTGYLGEAEVPQINAMRRDAERKVSPDSHLEYIVVDVSGLVGFDRKSRRMHMASLREWHQTHPFRTYIFYGVNTFIATAARMASPSMPFKVEVATDIDHAFDLIRKDKAMSQAEPKSSPENQNDPSGKYAEELISFIDALNWEMEGSQHLPETVDQDHPFYFAFQSILLIKAELDGLFMEQKINRNALQESEKKYRTLFENGSDLLFLHDLDGNLLETNPAFKRGFGVDDDQTLDINIRDFIAERFRQEFDEYIERILRQGNDTGIATIATADGSELVLEFNNVLVRDAAGRPVGVSGSGRDITARIRAEKETLKLQEQLRQRQKLEAIGTLAGGIAHDFNNIISIVLGNAELAQDMTPAAHPTQDFLDEILTACVRARDVVRQLLTFSRHSDVRPEPMNMSPIIKESLKLLRSTIPRSIEFRYGIPAQIPAVAADPGHLHQIIINLINNAADAMDGKGGVIEIDLQPVSMDDEAASAADLSTGDYIRLAVSDSGLGISPENLGRIFDPYFTTKDIGKGTGMGLATVHGLMKRYKGSIRVYPRKGGGTRFELFFPTTADAAKPAEHKAAHKMPTGSETILFVDDEEPIAELSRRHLEALGYGVHGTTNPVEALRWFQDSPDRFDLIITDMAMPHLTGDKLAEAVLQIRPDKPIILCTGYSEMMSKERAMNMGIRAFMEKPVERIDLALAVRQVLDNQ
ncbi:MAG: PAS domain S-box protein [Desulfobacterales bacterium]|nr:PAS domain S-box protein [Desulfobacterales bacterium]